MFPFKDNIPTERFPVITVAFIVINVLVYLFELSLGELQLQQFFGEYGMTPCLISGVACSSSDTFTAASAVNPAFLTLFTSMFVHAGPLHLGGNMLYLWIFGNNVEDSMGRIRFVVFYLICGLVASAAQIGIEPSSVIPNVGASGAIAGVLGAYLLLYPRARVTTLVFLLFFITFIELPAVVVLVFWFVFQIFYGTASLYSESSGGGVAYFAHIGGFIAGFLLIKLFTKKNRIVYIPRSR
jgi:membrane associated rhomboid family serine protease